MKPLIAPEHDAVAQQFIASVKNRKARQSNA